MEVAFDFLAYITPFVAAAVAVPAFDYVKKYVAWVRNRGAFVKQVLVAAGTYGLAYLSNVVSVALPETIQGLTLDSTEALIAAGLAFAIKAGKQATENKED